MPDWTYHPFFKPLMFCLPPESARRATLALLAIQGRTSVGRAVFRMFGHVHAPDSVAVDAFGLRFASPVGLAPGIDTDGTALAVMQYLGFGFLEVGPVGAAAVARRHGTNPRRLRDLHAIVRSDDAGGPGAAELAERITAATAVSVPVSVSLRGPDVAAALAATHQAADFVTLPGECGRDGQKLARLRAMTTTPLLLRLPADWSDRDLDAAVDAAVEAQLDGFVAAEAPSTPLLAGGRLYSPELRKRSLELVGRVTTRSELPVIGTGGIASPDDARAFLDRGARLIELYEGLVYTGPGLPGRIVHAVAKAIAHPAPARGVDAEPEAQADAPSASPRGGWSLVALTGVVLVASGVLALVIAATWRLLPPDEAFLGMTAADLCRYHDCKIVHFMVHDRVSFGGSIISVGLVYLWLASVPLRRGEAWSWWTIVISGFFGFASFLTYLGYGYLDPWHGVATLLLLPWFVVGLGRSYRGLRHPRGLSSLVRDRTKSWLWSPAGRGRSLVGFATFGMISGGLTIMIVGMTWVFVPQDLEFLGLGVDELRAINPRLVSLIAHDRAGFGGGLFSGGIAIMAVVVCGVRPAAPGLWWALLGAGLAGFGTAIGIHPVVGYTSFIHLLPAYLGAAAFLGGMWLLYRPMCRTDEPSRRFSDL